MGLWFKKVVDLGLRTEYKQNLVVSGWVRKFYALPFLPPEKIQGF
jgi:hypothetical protein